MTERMKIGHLRASSFGGVPISVVLLLAVLTICGGIRLLPRMAESGSRVVMVLVAAIIIGLVMVPMLPKRKRKRKRKPRESKTK
ncbi:MAG: membrane protein YdbS with pleckstrin-like domain [Rhodothermales bacterium]|jgi:membrane protein YdbS with pleckstrin-like domain